MSIGAAIKRRRLELNKTLEQIAEQAKTDVGNLSRLERGHQNPTLKFLKRVAHALDISIHRLIAQGEGYDIPEDLNEEELQLLLAFRLASPEQKPFFLGDVQIVLQQQTEEKSFPPLKQ